MQIVTDCLKCGIYFSCPVRRNGDMCTSTLNIPIPMNGFWEKPKEVENKSKCTYSANTKSKADSEVE